MQFLKNLPHFFVSSSETLMSLVTLTGHPVSYMVIWYEAFGEACCHCFESCMNPGTTVNVSLGPSDPSSITVSRIIWLLCKGR